MIRVATLCLVLLATPALPQGTGVTLGGLSVDRSAPVEVAADSLSVDQASGTALFEGGVRVGQGDLRVGADRVRVVYAGTGGRIASLTLEGAVTLSTPTEAAEADAATYDIDAGRLTMTGDVLLTQGPAAIAADRMTIDLATGAARMEGSVRTVFGTGE
ncbi:MAG: LptA/OstA family protein [Paracoccaceae bacterium]